MTQKTLNLKTLRNTMILLFLSLSFSGFANIDVDLSTSENAVSKTVSGTSNGVSTYKNFVITIPFFSHSLDELNLKSYNSACTGNVMINVNGNTSNYSNPSQHNMYRINNLQEGTTIYTVMSLCNGVPNMPTQLIKIIVVREAAPVLDINLTTKCLKQNGTYNGYVGLYASGSYTNASKLYIQTTASNSSCPFGSKKITSLGGSNLPYGSFGSTLIYQCNKNGTFDVKLVYASQGVNGVIRQEISNGTVGWENYSYMRRTGSCITKVRVPFEMKKPAGPLDGSSISMTNPVKKELNLYFDSDDNANYEVEIYDFSGLSIKRASFKNVNAKSTNIIDVQDLKKGIYIVAIKNGDSVIRKKMIKE